MESGIAAMQHSSNGVLHDDDDDLLPEGYNMDNVEDYVPHGTPEPETGENHEQSSLEIPETVVTHGDESEAAQSAGVKRERVEEPVASQKEQRTSEYAASISNAPYVRNSSQSAKSLDLDVCVRNAATGFVELFKSVTPPMKTAAFFHVGSDGKTTSGIAPTDDAKSVRALGQLLNAYVTDGSDLNPPPTENNKNSRIGKLSKEQYVKMLTDFNKGMQGFSRMVLTQCAEQIQKSPIATKMLAWSPEKLNDTIMRWLDKLTHPVKAGGSVLRFKWRTVARVNETLSVQQIDLGHQQLELMKRFYESAQLRYKEKRLPNWIRDKWITSTMLYTYYEAVFQSGPVFIPATLVMPDGTNVETFLLPFSEDPVTKEVTWHNMDPWVNGRNKVAVQWSPSIFVMPQSESVFVTLCVERVTVYVEKGDVPEQSLSDVDPLTAAGAFSDFFGTFAAPAASQVVGPTEVPVPVPQVAVPPPS